MNALTPVRVKDCTCPDQPHPDGHHVFVAATISLEGGMAAEQAMLAVATKDYPDEAARVRTLTYAWAPIFARYASVDWDFCDDNGDPIPFDVDVILGDYSIARLVADKAGDLGYGTAVMAPFLTKAETRSPRGVTPVTTSPRRRQTPKPSA